MRQLLILIFIFSIISSCNQKKSSKIKSKFDQKPDLKTEIEFKPKIELETIQVKKVKDTINNYWALILDTISSKKEFKVYDLKHVLELKTYSLNDSSIVRNLASNREQVYLDHSHKMVTDFKLFTNSFADKKQIDRTNFEKILIPEFYTECNLLSTKIDSISRNTIYLTSDLNVPDTGNQWRVWYSINIENEKIGNIEIKESNYVGN